MRTPSRIVSILGHAGRECPRLAIGLALTRPECQNTSSGSREPAMPTYVYECAKCGDEFEQWQSFSDDPLKKHPGCGGKVSKVLQPVGIVFKGSGFHKTDSRSGAKRSRGSENGDGQGDKDRSSSDSSDGTTDTKTETKTSDTKKADTKKADTKKSEKATTAATSG